MADDVKGLDRGGYARHPCLYSPKALRVRKGEIGRQIRPSAILERGIRRRRGKEEGAPDTWGHGVSDGEGKEGARTQAAGWARPKREAGERREVGRAREGRPKRRAAGLRAELGQNRDEQRKSFSFSFSNISKHFPKIF
jgi:hypothetical protein